MTAPEHDLFHWDLGEDGVVVVTMDDPTQSANTMNDRFVEQLPVVVDRLWAERDSLTGVVIASAKKTFFAGGDLELLVRAGADDAAARDDGAAELATAGSGGAGAGSAA